MTNTLLQDTFYQSEELFSLRSQGTREEMFPGAERRGRVQGLQGLKHSVRKGKYELATDFFSDLRV